MNKKYRMLTGIALALLFTGTALASTNNVSTSSSRELHVFDQNTTVELSPLLSATPTPANITKVGESNMTDGIWQAIFSDILRAISILASLTSVVSLSLLVYNTRNANKKRRDERRSFVETGIITINNEFEPVTICTGNYDFKLNGYTVSLKTGESLIIPQPLPDPDYFEYLMIAGWGFAKKDGEPMGNMKSKEELGTVTFLKDDQVKAGKTIKIVQPEWSSLGNPDCIKFLDANPDLAYGDDPSVEEIRKKGIVGKVKSDYTNIHTHWIDLNIYVNILEIPEGAKHIKISLTKPNRTYISLNIAEIIPVTKKEYGKIKKALEKEIQSEAIKNGELKKLLELYQRLRNEQKPTDDDKGKLWSSADEYIEKKDFYTAYKLIKYALILENNLEGRNKEILEKLMSTLNEKAENEELENESYFKDAVQSCVMLSHLYGVKAKFDHQHKVEWKKKEVEYIKKAGDMIEMKSKKDKDKELYEALMNLQWRCYVSATKKYEEMSNLQKAMEIRVKLNEVFERITKRHPFSSPIIDNVFENFNEETNLTEKRWNVSLRDK
jgi:hypothetical protein